MHYCFNTISTKKKLPVILALSMRSGTDDAIVTHMTDVFLLAVSIGTGDVQLLVGLTREDDSFVLKRIRGPARQPRPCFLTSHLAVSSLISRVATVDGTAALHMHVSAALQDKRDGVKEFKMLLTGTIFEHVVPTGMRIGGAVPKKKAAGPEKKKRVEAPFGFGSCESGRR